jgi:hypothetical protein
LNRNILKNYGPEAERIVSIIGPKVNNRGPLSFEQCVAQVEVPAQLTALRFYLRDFFEDLSRHYRSENNFHVLVDQIERSPSKSACVVTFNYDTLFERTLRIENKWQRMAQYTATPISLIKLHGSCNWSYMEHASTDATDFHFFRNKTDYIELDVHTNNYLRENNVGRIHRLPALAVPAGATKRFVCPDSHIKSMEATMNQADRVLIIGWKAGDPELIKIMEKTMADRPVSYFIVAGSPEGVKEIWSKFEHINGASLMGEAHSFSEFVRSEMCPTFFGTKY